AANLVKNNSGVQLMPNPVHDKLRITYYAESAATETISITNAAGRIVYTQKINSRQGDNTVDILLPASQGNGLYLLKAGNRTPVKFVKE
ncbi:MAG: T9SS type A sorting domain-containing protein, partial [Dinghuibacter sp.]|nr:T9SS type A sorting domain-containing protein [Dinghuibacter sp.]